MIYDLIENRNDLKTCDIFSYDDVNEIIAGITMF